MNQFPLTPPVLATDIAEAAASSGAIGRIIVVVLLTVTLALAVRSLRMIWEPISEIVGLLMRAGAVALLAVAMLIAVVVLTIGYV